MAKGHFKKQVSQTVIEVKNPSKLRITLPYAKLILFLCIIATLAYANTLKNDYALDDFVIIKNSTIVKKGVSAIPEIFTTAYHQGSNNDFYRPLSVVMFATEYSLFGFNPGIEHLVNIMLFAACVILLFRFLDTLFEHRKTTAVFIACLLFALHPIHTEVVANIKSRDEILCFFFGFLALNIFLTYQKRGETKYLALGFFALFLSYLSKETVITFLGLIPLIFFFYKNENTKRSIYISVVTIVATVLFLFIRNTVLSSNHANNFSDIPFLDNPLASKHLAYSSRFATAIFILGYYARLLLMPYPLICDYSYNAIPIVTFSNTVVLFSLAFYAFLAITGIMRLFKNPKDPFAFAILFFLTTISLFSNIFFLISGAMAERFIFFSSAGFCLLIALLIDKWLIIDRENPVTLLKNSRALAILIPICLLYAGLTINRNNDWFNSITLFRTDIEKSPDNSRLHCFLGTELSITIAPKQEDPEKEMQVLEEACRILNKAITIYPDYYDAHHEIGQTYFRIRKFDSAEVHDKRALQLAPGDLKTMNNLAGVYFMKKDYRESLNLCREILKTKPCDVNTITNMSLCYVNIEQFDSAIYLLRKAIIIDPGFNSVYENMAIAYITAGIKDSAKKYESIAQVKNPEFKLKW